MVAGPDLVSSGIFFWSEAMLKSIDAQRGPLYNWAGAARAEAVVVAVAVAVADSKVSLSAGFLSIVFLEHRELARAKGGGDTRESCHCFAKRY